MGSSEYVKTITQIIMKMHLLQSRPDNGSVATETLSKLLSSMFLTPNEIHCDHIYAVNEIEGNVRDVVYNNTVIQAIILWYFDAA